MEHTPNPPTDGADPAGAEQRLVALRRRHAIDELPLANWCATPAGGVAVEIAEGDPWPTGADPISFDRHTATIPAAWPLGDVRLDLDVGVAADVTLHSRFGPETHCVAAGGSALKPPTRAFGIRIVAHARGGAPRLGVTRLVLVDPELGDALGRLEGELDPTARERALTELEHRPVGDGPAAGAPHGGAAPT